MIFLASVCSRFQIVSLIFAKGLDFFKCVMLLVSWSESVEKALQAIEQRGDGDLAPLVNVLQVMEATLNVLADSVLHEQPPVRRKKLEHLVRICGLYSIKQRESF
jgi:hypothetical protein